MDSQASGFDLSVVDEGLLEDAVLVTNAVGDARRAEGGHAVDETGGQAAQATVAQPGSTSCWRRSSISMPQATIARWRCR